MDERVLAERLITYDTSSAEGLRAAAGFVKGWLESREMTVEDRSFDDLPVVLAATQVVVGREERSLERRFGAAYRSYRASVRRYL